LTKVKLKIKASVTKAGKKKVENSLRVKNLKSGRINL